LAVVRAEKLPGLKDCGGIVGLAPKEGFDGVELAIKSMKKSGMIEHEAFSYFISDHEKTE